MAAPTDPALSDPRRVFDDRIHNLAKQAHDQGLTSRDVVINYLKTEDLAAVEELIKKADPPYPLTFPIQMPSIPIDSPKHLERILQEERRLYYTNLLAWYVSNAPVPAGT